MSDLTTETSPEISLHLQPGAAQATGPQLGLGLSREHVQWRAERLQVCNWGGFDGVHEAELDWESTLLTGGSGTGKSTLGDAWLALVQPSGTAFNAASNPSKARPRSEGQRNTLSYARGHLDKKTTDGGTKEVRKLRGHTGPVWSAIAMTFRSTTGERYTAFRLMHVMPSHRIDSEATVRLCSVNGPLDIERLAEAAPEKFTAAAIKRVVPGVTIHSGPRNFQDRFAAKLGIGSADGAGAQKALRMLERIQSGQPVSNVNELFTRYVLEEPHTLRDADKALAEWDRLEDAVEIIDLNTAKYEVLRDIRELHAKVEEASQEQQIFRGLGLDQQMSAWALWCARDEERVLDAAADANRGRRQQAALDVTGTEADEQEAKAVHLAARKAFEEYSRGELNGLREQLARAESDLGAAIHRRGTLSAAVSALAPLPETREAFEQLRVDALDVRNGFEDAKAKLEADHFEVQRDQFTLLDRKGELTRERDSFGSRQGRVDPKMDELRNQAAAIADIDPRDLPYAAELLDIAEGHEQWREAVETILWPVASCILLDDRCLEAFSAAIDDAGLRGRINFEGVPLHRMSQAHPGEDRVGGKVVYKDSPFQGWLRDRLAKPDLNALCVLTPGELRSEDRTEVRVTIAGQTRRRKRGSAGRRNRRHIIGFSNEAVIETINAQLAELEPQIEALGARHRDLRAEIDRLMRRHEAAGALVREDWASLDVAAIEGRRDDLTRTISKLTSGDSQLARLEAAANLAEEEWLAARDLASEARKEVNAAASEHGQIVSAQDRLTPRLERLYAAGVELSAVQDELLRRNVQAEYREWNRIGQAHSHMRTQLETLAKKVNAETNEATGYLLSAFRAYLATWGENHPSLEASLDCYPDFVAILEEIEAFGLHEAAARFRADLVNWSGQQLLRLNGSFEAARSDIEDRMEAINGILKGLPFGVRNEALHIRVDRRQSQEVTDFRRELQSLAMRRTEELPEAEVMPYFRAAQALLARIRKTDDPRAKPVPGAPSRGALLDVRRHINIEADRIEDSGGVGGTYDTLGTQSGGESQELLAFILGTALRYQLGDEEHDRPTFAFVVLDEAFVKADPEFAGRSMKLWQSLGFQLLVAAPVDKFTALEPFAQRFLLTEKDEDERCYVGPIDRAEALTYTEAATLRGEHLVDDSDDGEGAA